MGEKEGCLAIAVTGEPLADADGHCNEGRMMAGWMPPAGLSREDRPDRDPLHGRWRGDEGFVEDAGVSKGERGMELEEKK